MKISTAPHMWTGSQSFRFPPTETEHHTCLVTGCTSIEFKLNIRMCYHQRLSQPIEDVLIVNVMIYLFIYRFINKKIDYQ